MRTFILILATACSLNLFAGEEKLNLILQAVDNNNLQLRSMRGQVEAEILATKSQSNLPDPTISYTHKYADDDAGEQESELAVTQGFEFPTAYATRHKFNRSQTQVYETAYAITRRDVLLQAKLHVLDLVGLNRQAALLNRLIVHADSIVLLCQRRLDAGDATILELNRAKLDRMSLQTELADNASRHRQALQTLTAMNANQPLTDVCTEYPFTRSLPPYEVVCDEVLPAKRELLQAEAQVQAARREVAVERSGWLPRLEVGYRRNTSPTREFNGFVVGGSIPLFSNRSKVKSARARSLSAELNQQSVALQTEADLQSLYNEAMQVGEAMSVYDLPLLNDMFLLLDKALHGGELPLSQYFEQMNNLIRRHQAYLDLENRFQKLVARLYADRL